MLRDIGDDVILTRHPDPLRGQRYLHPPVPVLDPLVPPVAGHRPPDGADHGRGQSQSGLPNPLAGEHGLKLGPSVPQQSHVKLPGDVSGSRNLKVYVKSSIYNISSLRQTL